MKKAEPRIYKSEISAAIHEMISDLHEIGLVDEETKQRFNESCLTPEVRRIIGAFSAPKDAALMDEVMELVMQQLQRRSDE